MLVLMQPAEFIIIGGEALGRLLIGTPVNVVKRLLSQLAGLFAAGSTKSDYADLLAMQYQLFKAAQQSGVMALEAHFEKPHESAIMSKYPGFLKRHHAVDFLADSIKVIIIGGIGAHDFEALMDQDLEVRHHEATLPATTLTKVGDALPGLGIVAAVLGIVITMGAIDGPAAEIGHKVGAALVGTFLGILLSYGFAQPLAAALEQRVASEGAYEQCLKAGVLAMYKGFSPMVSVEFARRVLPDEVRPTFDETEQICKGTREQNQAAAA
jgi:chemotaxis protein MotA